MQGMRVLELGALALLGFLVGAAGTLVGVGGGFVMVPILLFLYPERPAHEITAMSLVVVLANAMSGTIVYWRQRRIDTTSGMLFALASLPGTVFGAIFVRFIPLPLFTLIFGVVLLAIGGWMWMPRRVAAIRAPLSGRGVVTRVMQDRLGQTFFYSFRLRQGVLISAGVGFMSGLLGIGGGVVQVPAMAMVLHFPVHIATATSQFVLMLISLQATGTHLATGTLRFDHNLAQAGAIAVGAVLGAQTGARVAPRVRGEAIIRVLASALLVVAIRLIYSGLRAL
jgi:uncharacterized membrane protein YfcA